MKYIFGLLISLHVITSPAQTIIHKDGKAGLTGACAC